jgi:hypothetical protein
MRHEKKCIPTENGTIRATSPLCFVCAITCFVCVIALLTLLNCGLRVSAIMNYITLSLPFLGKKCLSN